MVASTNTRTMEIERTSGWRVPLAGVGLLAVLTIPAVAEAHNPPFTSSFMFETCGGFSSQGKNPFFVLQPGYQLVLAGQEDGVNVVLQITVLPQTIQIAGVTARIVEERETHGGSLVEVSRNYFVLCNRNNSAIYLGEDVDIFNEDGTVTHEGAWRAGVAGARPGIIMPGVVLVGARYFQEIAANVAMDRAEILSVSAVVSTPAGTFGNCVKTLETTPLDPAAGEFKFYAPGIGIVGDGPLRLVFATGLD